MNHAVAIRVNGWFSMYYTFPAFARWAMQKKTAAETPAPDDTIEPKKSPESEEAPEGNIDTKEVEQ